MSVVASCPFSLSSTISPKCRVLLPPLTETLGPPPYTQTLRAVAHRYIKYEQTFELANAELRRDGFAEIASRPPKDGREYVSFGSDGAGQEHCPEGVRKWANNPALLFEKLAVQDVELFGEDGKKMPTCPEEWFWRSTMAFGSYTTLRRYTMLALSKKPMAWFDVYTTILSREAALAMEPLLTSSNVLRTRSAPVHSSPLAMSSPEPQSACARPPTLESVNSQDAIAIFSPKASTAFSREWQRVTISSEFLEAEIRQYIFMYTFLHPDDDSEEETLAETVWKVVGVTIEEGEENMYTVAMDWNSADETRERLPWDEVKDMIGVPESYWCLLPLVAQ
ncbi:hypothetical protein BDV98DRAFT_586483 [Pterulicium gracile]|uniref:Uncharacterized protein n=1 Tax=Pterulicium gracile TaxID=1884261 RepID=A0A5C3Q3A6_9AGAR|nr:hypothetical protein BDV98DRAFT_586483 [Pterula gracilis]